MDLGEFLGKLCVVIALLGIFISVIVIATYDGGTKNKLTEPERLLENEYSLVGSFCNMYIINTGVVPIQRNITLFCFLSPMHQHVMLNGHIFGIATAAQ